MLVVSRDMRYSRLGTWCPSRMLLKLCGSTIRDIFDIPDGTLTITMSLHTTPTKDRLRVALRNYGKGARYINPKEPEHLPLRGKRIPESLWRIVKKYKGKPLYLEVTY